MFIDRHTPVRTLIRTLPGADDVFRGHGIEPRAYEHCTLGQAVEYSDADVDALISDLRQLDLECLADHAEAWVEDLFQGDEPYSWTPWRPGRRRRRRAA